MITLKHVSKVYGKKQNAFTALDDVSISIKKGTTVAIVGKSGSGKSTLMHVMSGLDSATQGVIEIAGTQLQHMSPKQIDAFRNKKMSFIFQSFFIEPNQTCLDNVMLPLEIGSVARKFRKKRALEALTAVELESKAKAKARNLSGGQKQRLAIARAIINNPELIFADEPTGNLDSRTGDKVVELLFDLRKRLGASVIIVTHDHDLAQRCDAQIYIKDGAVEKITGKKGAVLLLSAKEAGDVTMVKSSTRVQKIAKRIKAKVVSTVHLLNIFAWPKKLFHFIKHMPLSIRRARDLVGRSFRTLKSAKVRTLLTAAAIGVGGFTLTLTLAAGNGVRDYTDKLVQSNFDPAELIVGRDREISNNSSPSDKPQEYDETVGTLQGGGGQNSFQIKRVTESDLQELRANPNIEQVRESFQITVRYITREGQKRYTGSAQVFNAAQKPEVKAGDLPKTGDIAKGTILIPDTYVEPLGFKDAQDALGKQISVSVQQPFSLESLQTLLGQDPSQLLQLDPNALKPKEQLYTYTIGAVTKKSATSLSFGVSPILLSSADSRELYDFTEKGTQDYEKYLFVYARVKDGQDDTKLQAVRKELEDKGYYVQSSKDIQKTITQFVNILQTMVGVLGLITLIASVFGVVNTQYISVLERTREIGLMKALGMSRKNISRLFLLEAAWIGFLGGLIGILGGTMLGITLNPVITDKLDLGDGNTLLQFSFVQSLILLIALMLVAAFAGLLPARKAAKLDPVEALRTE